MIMVSKLWAVIGLAIIQSKQYPGRTLLGILGVTLAVLAMTTLAGVGLGVVDTGEQQFEQADRDLWVTGGPLEFTTARGGSIEAPIVDAHELSDDLESHDGVRNAAPLLFQVVYVSTDGESFEQHTVTGVPGGGPAVQIADGESFSGGDHRAGGAYDGPMSYEILIDSGTADRFGIDIGDTLYMGGSIRAAQQHEFEIVGISPTFAQFTGTPTITMHLDELQQITGMTTLDQASLITVTLEDDVEVSAVRSELEAAHPEYDIRTNEEQLVQLLEEQAVILASGVSLVILAVLAGIGLTANLLLSFIQSQRRELAALRALGLKTGTLGGIVLVQSLGIAVLGGVLGVALTIPAVRILNELAAAMVGFEGLVQTTEGVLLGGFVVAVSIGILTSLVAVVRLTRLAPLATLRGG